VTGQRLGLFPTRVEARASELRQIYEQFFGPVEPPPPETTSTGGGIVLPGSPPGSDDWVLQQCAKAKTGYRFSDLWNNTGGDNPSSGDLALLNILAFYSQDVNQLDRLFRQSQRMRPKWDEFRRIRGELTTYGRMTIDAALAGLRSTYQRRAR
jgi:putative DNA primase/helicase